MYILGSHVECLCSYRWRSSEEVFESSSVLCCPGRSGQQLPQSSSVLGHLVSPLLWEQTSQWRDDEASSITTWQNILEKCIWTGESMVAFSEAHWMCCIAWGFQCNHLLCLCQAQRNVATDVKSVFVMKHSGWKMPSLKYKYLFPVRKRRSRKALNTVFMLPYSVKASFSMRAPLVPVAACSPSAVRCRRCGACPIHCAAAPSSANCCHCLLSAGEGAEAHTGSVNFFVKSTAVKVIQTGMGQRFIYWFFLLIMETFILLWAAGVTFLIGEASYLAGSHLWEMLLLLAFSLRFREIQSWIQSSMEVRTWGSWSYCVPS